MVRKFYSINNFSGDVVNFGRQIVHLVEKLYVENQSTDLEGYQVLLYRCKSETLTKAADDFVF